MAATRTALGARQLIAEAVGSFVFFAVIMVDGSPLAVAAALLGALYFGGGDYNPAASLMRFSAGRIDAGQLAALLGAQALAAVAAALWSRAR